MQCKKTCSYCYFYTQLWNDTSNIQKMLYTPNIQKIKQKSIKNNFTIKIKTLLLVDYGRVENSFTIVLPCLYLYQISEVCVVLVNIIHRLLIRHSGIGNLQFSAILSHICLIKRLLQTWKKWINIDGVIFGFCICVLYWN